MKNLSAPLLLFLMFLWLFSSCSKNIVDPQLSDTISSIDSLHVSFEIAKGIAVQHYINNQGKSQSGNTSNARMEGITGDKIIDSSFSFRDKKGRDFMYFFRFRENKGWNLISGDKRMFPILAYSNEGYARLDTSKNPGLKFWVDDMLMLVDAFDKETAKPVKGIEKDWKKYLDGKLQKANGRSNYDDDSGPTGCTETFDKWANLNNPNIGFTGLAWN